MLKLPMEWMLSSSGPDYGCSFPKLCDNRSMTL